MTARIVSLEAEKAARQRTQKRPGCEAEQYGQGIDGMGHFDRLQAQFETSLGPQQTAGQITILDTEFRRNLSQLPAHGLQSVAVYMGLVAAATATAALILHQTERLLTHAVSLLTATNLCRGDRQCSGTATRTQKQPATGNFGEGT